MDFNKNISIKFIYKKKLISIYRGTKLLNFKKMRQNEKKNNIKTKFNTKKVKIHVFLPKSQIDP